MDQISENPGTYQATFKFTNCFFSLGQDQAEIDFRKEGNEHVRKKGLVQHLCGL
ncbi:MAG TPA: hypothetical protein VFR24_06895 [Candidatus Angelobacter sp.]|jgi:hypothetical protein|nr:hypothetical protein [Candidatus Angelobacter sp.]